MSYSGGEQKRRLPTNLENLHFCFLTNTIFSPSGPFSLSKLDKQGILQVEAGVLTKNRFPFAKTETFKRHLVARVSIRTARFLY